MSPCCQRWGGLFHLHLAMTSYRALSVYSCSGSLIPHAVCSRLSHDHISCSVYSSNISCSSNLEAVIDSAMLRLVLVLHAASLMRRHLSCADISLMVLRRVSRLASYAVSCLESHCCPLLCLLRAAIAWRRVRAVDSVTVVCGCRPRATSYSGLKDRHGRWVPGV